MKESHFGYNTANLKLTDYRKMI